MGGADGGRIDGFLDWDGGTERERQLELLEAEEPAVTAI